MTAYKYVTLWCDGPECDRHFQSSEGVNPAARREARGEDWCFIAGKDYCPKGTHDYRHRMRLGDVPKT